MDPARFWDEQAAAFDSEPDHGLRDIAIRRAWRELLRAALPNRSSQIVDLGCGTGSLTVLLAAEGHVVTGLDVAPRMVAAAIAKARSANVHADIRLGDASNPDLPPKSVDVVLARHVVWSLPDPRDALERWAALLAEGGRFVLIEGRWSTGTGIGASELEAVLPEGFRRTELQFLSDSDLWGTEISDDRYLMVARR